MKQSTSPQIPPALRKARPAKELSDAFPPIIARPRPEPPPPAPAPVVVAAPEAAIPPAPPSKPSPTPEPPKPTAKPSPLPPVAVAPVAVAVPAPPTIKTRPKPVFTGRPPVAQLEGKVVVFEGTFRCEENASFTTETRLTGDPRRDKQSLINLARKRYPTGQMELKSTRVFTREVSAVISFAPGTTLGQLFGAAGTSTEAQVEIGTVFFDGVRCQIFLRNLRSRNAVTLSLRQPTGGNVNFSNQIQANRLAKELPFVTKEVFGNNVRELVITLKEATA